MSGFVEGSAAGASGAPLIAPGLLAGQLQQQQRHDGQVGAQELQAGGRRGGHDGGGRTSLVLALPAPPPRRGPRRGASSHSF